MQGELLPFFNNDFGIKNTIDKTCFLRKKHRVYWQKYPQNETIDKKSVLLPNITNIIHLHPSTSNLKGAIVKIHIRVYEYSDSVCHI